ncbi:DUF5063 domain-containing protein [Anaerobacillus sp. MEB173]|uniref:DUF5063 domain-containing protein n=1 Tax=Anaerobacillus sp. MEB173 TaxID=3383345 RepID=UPI003F913427
MKIKEAEWFLQSALHYCNQIDLFNNNDEGNKLYKILVSLSDLYTKALSLPEVEPKNSQVASFDIDLPRVNFKQYEKYWEVFEPYHLEELICTSLADDILDIYKDVKEGILLYEQNEHMEAIWHWKFHFEVHWGSHAVDAMRALHSANFS